ncbi:unnamed protein product [Protopolystoma xenopodis]|uniref:Uncharacterized protein n=1 Tax=Protopolystoma xenopodis TaxID=117903 RepID=A0A3S5FFP0_9PLAT|nr:unnamed protein product [Protopolystoma xenopodis]
MLLDSAGLEVKATCGLANLEGFLSKPGNPELCFLGAHENTNIPKIQKTRRSGECDQVEEVSKIRRTAASGGFSLGSKTHLLNSFPLQLLRHSDTASVTCPLPLVPNDVGIHMRSSRGGTIQLSDGLGRAPDDRRQATTPRLHHGDAIDLVCLRPEHRLLDVGSTEGKDAGSVGLTGPGGGDQRAGMAAMALADSETADGRRLLICQDGAWAPPLAPLDRLRCVRVQNSLLPYNWIFRVPRFIPFL